MAASEPPDEPVEPPPTNFNPHSPAFVPGMAAGVDTTTTEPPHAAGADQISPQYLRTAASPGGGPDVDPQLYGSHGTFFVGRTDHLAPQGAYPVLPPLAATASAPFTAPGLFTTPATMGAQSAPTAGHFGQTVTPYADTRSAPAASQTPVPAHTPPTRPTHGNVTPPPATAPPHRPAPPTAQAQGTPAGAGTARGGRSGANAARYADTSTGRQAYDKDKAAVQKIDPNKTPSDEELAALVSKSKGSDGRPRATGDFCQALEVMLNGVISAQPVFKALDIIDKPFETYCDAEGLLTLVNVSLLAHPPRPMEATDAGGLNFVRRGPGGSRQTRSAGATSTRSAQPAGNLPASQAYKTLTAAKEGRENVEAQLQQIAAELNTSDLITLVGGDHAVLDRYADMRVVCDEIVFIVVTRLVEKFAQVYSLGGDGDFGHLAAWLRDVTNSACTSVHLCDPCTHIEATKFDVATGVNYWAADAIRKMRTCLLAQECRHGLAAAEQYLRLPTGVNPFSSLSDLVLLNKQGREVMDVKAGTKLITDGTSAFVLMAMVEQLDRGHTACWPGHPDFMAVLRRFMYDPQGALLPHDVRESSAQAFFDAIVARAEDVHHHTSRLVKQYEAHEKRRSKPSPTPPSASVRSGGAADTTSQKGTERKKKLKLVFLPTDNSIHLAAVQELEKPTSATDSRPALGHKPLAWTYKQTSPEATLGALSKYTRLASIGDRDWIVMEKAPTIKQLESFDGLTYAMYLMLARNVPPGSQVVRSEGFDAYNKMRGSKGAKPKRKGAAATKRSGSGDQASTTSSLTASTDGADSSSAGPTTQQVQPLADGSGGMVIDGKLYYQQPSAGVATPAPAPTVAATMTPGDAAKATVEALNHIEGLPPQQKATVMQAVTTSLTDQPPKAGL